MSMTKTEEIKKHYRGWERSLLEAEADMLGLLMDGYDKESLLEFARKMTTNYKFIKKADKQKLKEVEREAEERTYLDIAGELQKHKFNTGMAGWDIVPKLVATMELLGFKYLKKEDESKE